MKQRHHGKFVFLVCHTRKARLVGNELWGRQFGLSAFGTAFYNHLEFWFLVGIIFDHHVPAQLRTTSWVLFCSFKSFYYV